MTATTTDDLRSRFYRLLPELLAEDPSVLLTGAGAQDAAS